MTATSNTVTPITDQRRACIDLLYGGQEPSEVESHAQNMRNVHVNHHVHALFTDQQVLAIRRRYQAGEATIAALAREHGVKHTAIWRMANGITYRHLPTKGGPDAAAD